MSTKGTQVQGKIKQSSARSGLCPRLCNLVPKNVPAPGATQAVLHPRKDVFLLKVFHSYHSNYYIRNISISKVLIQGKIT